VTSNSQTDQQSALVNLDQVPYATGTGKSLQLPLTLSLNPPQGTCTILPLTIGYNSNTGTSTTTSCPNNAANFGSATGTIGGSRAIVVGFHITY